MARHADVPVEAAANRLLRRSRTGCLTCRRRKKKCPEQYDSHGDCVRCQEGGWRCIRPGHTEPTSSSTSRLPTEAPVSSEISSSSLPTVTPDFAPTEPDWNAFFDNLNSETLQDLPGPSRHVDNLPELPDPTPFDPARLGTMTLPDVSPLDFGKLSEWLLQPMVDESFVETAWDEACQPHPGLADDVSGESTFCQPSWPSFALSGDTSNCKPSNAQTTDDFTTHDPSEPYEDLLVEFYANYVVPAWTVTYTRQTRQALAAQCLSLTSSCPLTRIARRAVAATFLQLYKERKKQWPMGSSSRQAALDALSPHYLVPDIDPKPIMASGLAMVTRLGHETDLSALLWAISDLNMAAHALSDAPNWYLTCELAESLFKNVLTSPGASAAHFPDPEFFPMRVATMCDFNNSLTNRRRTVFDYSSAATRTWPRDMSLVCDKETTWFGLPPGLALLLLRVANMTADSYSASKLGLPSSGNLMQEANKLETELVDYQPKLQEPAPQHPSEPFEVSSAERAVEMDIWKTMGLVLLDRLVHHRPVFETPLRERLEDMQAMLQALILLCRARERKSNNFIDFWSAYCSGPAFLIGSLAVHETERQFYRRFLREIGPEKSLGSLLEILEKTWKASDAAGEVCDWFDVIAESDSRPLFF